VVALVNGSDASLKRVYREPRNMVRLQPANQSMKPMYYPASDVEIQGRLLAVLRKFR
jgi:repressor LexA